MAAEVAAVVGHGDGGAVSLPLLQRQLLPTESRSLHHLERERERERDKRKRKKKLWVQGLFVVVS